VAGNGEHGKETAGGTERLPDFQEGLFCIKVTNTEVKSCIIII
jgi:hypothetical protein